MMTMSDIRSFSLNYVFISGVGGHGKPPGDRQLLGHGKEHQAKTRQKYSTEDSGGCWGTRAPAYQSCTQAREQEEHREVRREEYYENLSGMQDKGAEGQGQPGGQYHQVVHRQAIAGLHDRAEE